MDKANKAIKEKYRVAVRKGLFQKLKGRCTGRRTKGQCDILYGQGNQRASQGGHSKSPFSKVEGKVYGETYKRSV